MISVKSVGALLCLSLLAALLGLVHGQQVVTVNMDESTIQIGIAGEDQPRLTIPHVYVKITYYGNDAYYTAGATYTVKNVFSKEVPVSWSDYVAIITHAFAEAGIVPSESVVIFTDHATNTMAWREKLAAEMFNNLKVQGFFIARRELFTLHSIAKWTGIAVNVGQSTTQIVPVVEGLIVGAAIVSLPLGYLDIRLDVRSWLDGTKTLAIKYPIYDSLVDDIFTALGYVALDFEEELRASKAGSSKDALYELPDGNVVTIGAGRFSPPEGLFNPSRYGKTTVLDIPNAVLSAIMKTAVDSRNDLWKNIVLSGKLGTLPGLPERLLKEMAKLAPQSIKPLVKIFNNGFDLSTWLGTSIFGNAFTFESMYVTADEYASRGAAVLAESCPLWSLGPPSF